MRAYWVEQKWDTIDRHDFGLDCAMFGYRDMISPSKDRCCLQSEAVITHDLATMHSCTILHTHHSRQNHRRGAPFASLGRRREEC